MAVFRCDSWGKDRAQSGRSPRSCAGPRNRLRRASTHGHPSMGFDFRPPHTAMADAHAVDVERLGDDDVVHARRREPAALRRYERRRSAGFSSIVAEISIPREIGTAIEQRLDGDDGSGEAALHIARASAEEFSSLTLPQRAPPSSRAGLDDVDMAVEMHAGPRSRPRTVRSCDAR